MFEVRPPLHSIRSKAHGNFAGAIGAFNINELRRAPNFAKRITPEIRRARASLDPAFLVNLLKNPPRIV
ncbi:MAG TPA: hypothetical protein PK867_31340, partial [Pirellulales bacterium]|nr:hypothetical protein [Pirellulales bacterium]